MNECMNMIISSFQNTPWLHFTEHYHLMLNPIHSQIETENFAKYREFPSKCSWDAWSTDKGRDTDAGRQMDLQPEKKYYASNNVTGMEI